MVDVTCYVIAIATAISWPFSATLLAVQSDCSRLYLHVEAPFGYSLQLTDSACLPPPDEFCQRSLFRQA